MIIIVIITIRFMIMIAIMMMMVRSFPWLRWIWISWSTLAVETTKVQIGSRAKRNIESHQSHPTGKSHGEIGEQS